MLTENEILERLEIYLIAKGYKVKHRLSTIQKGIDLIAEKAEETLYVEAKGETSASTTSNRFGKPFNPNQIKDHIAKAILASLEIYSLKPDGINTRVAIALPNNIGHNRVISKILPALRHLEISIFLVDTNTVTEV